MDAIRAFVAIELPPFVLDELAKIEARFKPQVPDACVRWVKPDSIHLTLKFLGQVPSDQIELITASLRTAVMSHHVFTLAVAGAGCFPNLSRPRVVWVGVQEEGHALHALQRAVENAIAPLGYPTEQRDFTPHLTLGRVARDVHQSDLKHIGEVVGASRVGSLGRWEVKQVALIKSDLQPTGAVYTILAHARLASK